MSHRARTVFARALAPLLASLLAVLLAACAGGVAQPSFDPTGPCSGDGAAPGAYPELEAQVPATYEGRAPDQLDSGRNCTSTNLGSLEAHGIEEVRFAGGTWDFGSDIAAVLAVFRADDLTAERMAEWWETTARANGRTEVTATATPTIDGRSGFRMDTKTGERLQTVVVWPSDADGQVNVVLTHNLPDPKIDAAIEAFSAD
jgi:hypothetical protein